MRKIIILTVLLFFGLVSWGRETKDQRKEEYKTLFTQFLKESIKSGSFSLKYNYNDSEDNKYDGFFAMSADTVYYTMGRDFAVWQQGGAIYSYTPSKQRVEIDKINPGDLNGNYLMLLSNPEQLLMDNITVELYEKRGDEYWFHFKDNESADRVILCFTSRKQPCRLMLDRSDGVQAEILFSDFKDLVTSIEKYFNFSPKQSKKIKFIDFR